MTECLDEEAMLSFGQGTMAPERRPSVEAHLSQCEECRALVSAVKRSSVIDREEVVAPVATSATTPPEPPPVSAPVAKARPSDTPAKREPISLVLVVAVVAVIVATAIGLSLR